MAFLLVAASLTALARDTTPVPRAGLPLTFFDIKTTSYLDKTLRGVFSDGVAEEWNLKLPLYRGILDHSAV
jgi:hypothetical protein